jgi:hypothetical protein
MVAQLIKIFPISVEQFNFHTYIIIPLDSIMRLERSRFNTTLIAVMFNKILILKFVMTGGHSNTSCMSWKYPT